MAKGQSKKLEQILFALARIPGMGFLYSYAQQVASVNARIANVEGKVGRQESTLDDVKSSLRNIRDNGDV